ncbi:DeoR/GlpR family DNA-binding transcription regulator [Paenibacillus sp. J22TS3]|uniref:DeoR/GlpR family DNA-binding transcription regulator n=1 Tax=Paenibacillus sp. J22TS3 TaxID=2807192 RepID=UPI001B1B066F|nr:DeoR/GlpR family DNA-binding transcription regulator [Paenibacillus sp. J22TS3]GIP20998.1 DeoR family transcriptional regulator [Paenibacillus sp. J22TS3]
MNSIRRFEKIMEVLLNEKEVTVNELSERLAVTGKTIRDDLSKLEQQGLIRRVHGGAILAQSDQFGILSTPESQVKHLAEKSQIAERAIRHIEPKDIIALDGGSTLLELARKLPELPLTVISNDVHIINELTPKEHIRLVVPGGYRVRNMLVGPEAVTYIRNLNINKAFISSTGVHLEQGLSVYTGDLIDYKRALIETAARSYAVVDSHKFGQSALRSFAALTEMTALITDNGLSPEVIQQYRSAGVNLEG